MIYVKANLEFVDTGNGRFELKVVSTSADGGKKSYPNIPLMFGDSVELRWPVEIGSGTHLEIGDME